MRKPRAFTIAELLVVIGIMMALVTLLVPSLQRFRMMGKRTLCSANLVDLSRAMNLYTNENKGVLPAYRLPALEAADLDGPAAGVVGKQRWWGRDEAVRHAMEEGVTNWANGSALSPQCEIFMYAENELLFRCPVLVSSEVPKAGLILEWELTPKDVGYGYNAFFLGRFDGSTGRDWLGFIPSVQGGVRPDAWCRVSYIKYPSRTILLSDATVRTVGGAPSGSYVTWWPSATMTNNAGVYPRHLDRANVVMLDGGVRQMYPDQVHDTTAKGKPQFWDPRDPR
ncbi:hypothetical protein LCGC14_0315640 [marine sediment metagenome]|uniref:Type II secretion system protein GspG C-terminal domain-containing protein n=1 Tax=marine sediment metagenome TaxID=412755 RepID=A0A0F9TR53_9ZZZZ|nr:type II secretion system protein [Phycisphaerae bacterium]HDZ44585.1 type II secretion system protein [Phycisphaerae bacterium]